MKIKKFILPYLCLSILSGMLMKPVNANDTVINDDYSKGVRIGSIIYDYDKHGNIIERKIDDKNTIKEEDLYINYIGNGEEVELTIPNKYKVISLDENGVQTSIQELDTFEEATKLYDELMLKNPKINYCVIDNDNNYLTVKYGVVKFKSIVSNGYVKNISYKNIETNDSGYLNPVYGVDAAYIGKEDNKVIFKMADVIGKVSEELVEIIPYTDKTTFVSYYKVEDGRMIHTIKSKDMTVQTGYSSSIVNGYVDKEQFVEKTVYYSYDGHYFYKNYFDMIDDYRADKYDNSVNKDKPYYSYYQFLSHRTKTIYTVEQINEFLKHRIGNKTSKMIDTGEQFINNQNIYGSNALLTIGVAVNESAWGTSNYAINKNNLFGHAAYDSNPDNATGYQDVNESIKYHTQMYVSKGYASPTIWKNGKVVLGANYFSSNLGNKGSGMNIKYASDPYWGEKNALFSYLINQHFNKEDYGIYTIGVKNFTGTLNIRKEPTSSSTLLYQTEEIRTVPFVILEEVKGEKIGNNDIWYKIVSDAPLTEDRTSYTTTNDTYEYDYANSYGYVHSGYVDKVFEGSGEIIEPEKPSTPEEPVIPPVEETCKHSETKLVNNKEATCTTEGYTGDKVCSKCGEVVEKGTIIPVKEHKYVEGVCSCGTKDPNYIPPFPLGDVSGDYKVTSLDFIKIKNYILKTKVLTEDEILRADVSKDGKITSLDFIKVKNHILGTSKLF